MNSNWANEYSKQHIEQMRADAQGDLLLRQAQADTEVASTVIGRRSVTEALRVLGQRVVLAVRATRTRSERA